MSDREKKLASIDYRALAMTLAAAQWPDYARQAALAEKASREAQTRILPNPGAKAEHSGGFADMVASDEIFGGADEKP